MRGQFLYGSLQGFGELVPGKRDFNHFLVKVKLMSR